MQETVFWILELAVKRPESNEASTLMEEMIAATRADEPGALHYEWHLSTDRKSCHIYERYANSSAVMTHLENFGEKFADRFMAVFEPQRFNVYGKADGAVKAALTGMGAVFNEPVGGFVRS